MKAFATQSGHAAGEVEQRACCVPKMASPGACVDTRRDGWFESRRGERRFGAVLEPLWMDARMHPGQASEWQRVQ